MRRRWGGAVLLALVGPPALGAQRPSLSPPLTRALRQDTTVSVWLFVRRDTPIAAATRRIAEAGGTVRVASRWLHAVSARVPTPVLATLSVAHGTLELEESSGLLMTQRSPDGRRIDLLGPPEAINLASHGLSYRSDAGFAGADALTVIINDLGQMGAGPALSTQQERPLLVPATPLATADRYYVSAGAANQGTVIDNDFPLPGSFVELVAGADVERLALDPRVHQQLGERRAVVLDVDPVAGVEAGAVDRERLRARTLVDERAHDGRGVVEHADDDDRLRLDGERLLHLLRRVAAVVGVAHQAMTAPDQFLVQHVEHQVRQQGRARVDHLAAFPRPSGRPARPPAPPRPGSRG